jgi:hypothetical protein
MRYLLDKVVQATDARLPDESRLAAAEEIAEMENLHGVFAEAREMFRDASNMRTDLGTKEYTFKLERNDG